VDRKLYASNDMKQNRTRQGIRNAYDRAAWTLEKGLQRFQKNPGDVLFEKRQMQKEMKLRQDGIRNAAADNLRDLQATVGRRAGVTSRGVQKKVDFDSQVMKKTKKWDTVKTGGSKGVGISKGGISTKPVALPGLTGSSSRSLGRSGGFRLGGVKSFGASMAGNAVGGAIKGALSENRTDPNSDYWRTYDQIAGALATGASFVNPIVGAIASPLLELFGQEIKNANDTEARLREDYDIWITKPGNEKKTFIQYQSLRASKLTSAQTKYGSCKKVNTVEKPVDPLSVINSKTI